MGTNTGIGIGIGIPFKNNALGGDRPYLPPELKARLIGVWDNYGKKNTDADRNIIKNKIPNAGGDLEILNAAYKLNSGFGEYKEDFTSWRIYPNIEVTDNVITTNGNFNSTWFIYKHANENEINEMNIKVSGIPEGGIIRYFYIPDETATTPVSYNISEDGVYHLPKSKLSSNRISVGFTVSSSYDWNNIRIEQLSDFGGAFVTDGINDIIISQKTLQEMGVTKDFTIVSMIHQISWRGSDSVPLTNYIRPTDNIYVRNQVADIGKTGIYGYVMYDVNNTSVSNSHVINTVLGDKNDYSVYTVGNLSQGKFSVQGYIDGNDNIREISSVAHYWTFALLGKATEDDINLIIAYFNLDRTLKPDILCNIGKQGITNDNHADFNDKLIDYSGNGRDIQMYNLAWKGGSGIAAKQYETFKDWTSESSSTSIIKQIDEFTRIVESSTNGYWVSRIRRDSDLDKVYSPINVYLYQDNNFLVHECKYEVDGVKYVIPINEPVGKGYHKLEIYTKDRYTELPENAENVVLSEWYFPKSTKGSIKYSIIPSCKGGILLDGINDFGKVIGMPVYKDYAIVVDYIRTSAKENAQDSPILSKSQVVNKGAFVFNYLDTKAVLNSYSFGINNGLESISDSERKIYYQSKYVNDGKSINSGTAIDYNSMWLGTYRDNVQIFFNGVIYSLMSFPYSMSEFLIERQLKKYKLGTLYPNMVEFRPVIKSNVLLDSKPTFVIRGTSTYLNAGDYVPENSQIWVSIKMNNIADRITKFTVNGKTIDIPENAYNEVTLQYGFPFVIDKSPQKIGITIEQDENYVLFNPVITSNVEYHKLDFYLNNYQKRINIGDYIPKDAYIRANFYLKNNVDELTAFIFNGVNIDYRRSSVDDTAFNIGYIYNYDSPQEVNITIDEYIRYEEIVQPYPVIFQITDRNTNQRYSWGDKIKVGSSIRLSQGEKPNLLSGLYSIQSYEYEGETYSYNQLTNLNIILTKQSISLSCNKTWLLDDNEPKCILSPRLLRIPNSSYKILGHIPDISGHGNHGVIHNSAYAEGSGVNEDGSYQFDGVDDFVTIPTIVGGKQVLMKVNWQNKTGLLYDQRKNGSSIDAFAILNVNSNNSIAYNSRNTDGETYIDGILNKNIVCPQLYKITHSITIINQLANKEEVISPTIGSDTSHKTYFSQMALYDFMLFDNISTDDKIKELNEYVGIEAKVELPPYYWDAYGKTNLDEDKATIQQRGVAIGDYDLINNNFAYEGMSGYNGYPAVFGTNKTYANLVPNDGNFILTSSHNIINVTKFDTSYGLLYSHIKLDGKLTSRNIDYPSYKIKVTGLGENFGLHYSYLESSSDTTVKGFEINNDGIYIIPKSFASDGSLTSNSDWIGFIFTGTAPESCNVTIEVLPEYENGLAYDGVTDYSENANIPAFTNYTYIFKRTIINIPTNAATLLKGADKTNGGAFIADYGNKWQFNFGQYNIIQGIADGINWQTVNSFNGTSINKGENTDDSGITVAKFSNGYTSMVFYKLILYPKTISLLEINFLKNLMEKDEIIDLNNPIFIKNE